MSQDRIKKLDSMLAAQDRLADEGYAAIVNGVVDTLKILTVWTAGYTSQAETQVPKRSIADAKRQVERLQGYADQNQAEDYEAGVMRVAALLLQLSEAFKTDPIISTAYGSKLRRTAVSMLGPTRSKVVETVDSQKGQVDISPLEVVADGLKAIDRGESTRKSFYEANKQHLPL